MSLTYSEFRMYQDAFGYVCNAETEKGQKENRIEDMRERCSAGITKEELAEIKKKLAPYVKKGE